ncbi:hypothetical protein D9M71_698670 [compost metagenome]
MAVGVGADGGGHLLRRRVLDADVEIVGVARRQRQVRVGVHVVQAGHAEGAVEAVHASLRADQMLQFRQAADSEEAAVADGHCIRPRLCRVEGVEAAVLQ